MTRRSSSGLQYLIRRSDSGKYAYWRTIADVLAPLLKGKIALSWALEPHSLDGKQAIKISLKTGDLLIAQRRWSDVHSQVEAMIDAAVAGAKNKKQPDPVLDVISASMPSSDRATIAAQARHDVMADHDADWTDPKKGTALARGLEQALMLRDSGQLPIRKQGQAEQGVLFCLADFEEFLRPLPTGMSLIQIREEARSREAAGVKQMLSSGQTWPLDSPTVVVEEVELDSDSPSGGRVVDTFNIPSELTERLNENRYELSDETERRTVAHAVLTAKAAAFQDIERRKEGIAIETPPRPAILNADNEVETFPTLLEMHDIWVGRIKPNRKTKDDNKLYVLRFTEMHGNLKVDHITRKQIRDFRDKLIKFPVAMPTEISAKPFLQIVEWAEKNDPIRLSPVTINAKGLGTLSTLMQLAVNEYDLPGDPSSNLRLRVSKNDVLDRHPFTPALLAKLPQSPVFQDPPKLWQAGRGAAAYWIPLIGLHSGGRLEEIGQLPLSDIKCDGEISYFWFRDDDEDDETSEKSRRRGKAKSEEDKSIKTKAGRRRVPIHRVLIELGLLDYIAARRAAGDKMLFPGLTQYRGRWTKNWSRWWARYLDKYITNDPAFVFHSFRHTFIGAMRGKKIRQDIMKALVGHARELDLDLRDAAEDITDKYGEAVPIAILNAEVQKIQYPGLHFQRIEAFLR